MDEKNNDIKMERISIRISPADKERVKKIAKKANRTMSNWCENLILETIDKIEKMEK